METREDIIAKNLLQGKTCGSCYHSGSVSLNAIVVESAYCKVHGIKHEIKTCDVYLSEEYKYIC